MNKLKIFVVIEIIRKDRKQFPHAICAYRNENDAINHRDNLISNGKKEDDIWIEKGCFIKNYDDTEKIEKIYPVFLIECKRPLCGFCNYAYVNKEDAEIYVKDHWPKSILKQACISGCEILECYLV